MASLRERCGHEIRRATGWIANLIPRNIADCAEPIDAFGVNSLWKIRPIDNPILSFMAGANYVVPRQRLGAVIHAPLDLLVDQEQLTRPQPEVLVAATEK